jgi:hypothetical protein
MVLPKFMAGYMRAIEPFVNMQGGNVVCRSS